MKYLRYSTYILTFSLLTLGFAGCKDGNISAPQVSKEIRILSPRTTIYFNDDPKSIQFNAEYYEEGSLVDNKSITWEVSDESIGTISSEGLLTVKMEGMIEVIASVEDLSASESISILKVNVPKPVVFRNVSLVNVETGSIELSKDIFIKNGFIELISTNTPDTDYQGYEIIEGTDYYLSPGITDAHTHVFFDTDFIQYLANGITSIIDMGDFSTTLSFPTLEWRDEIKYYKRKGPNYYPSLMVRGPQSSGKVTVSDGGEAMDIVKSNSEYDFIKSYNLVPPQALQALISEGNKFGIKVIGHGNRNLSMTSNLKLGQKMVAHSEEFLYTHFKSSQSEELIKDAINILLEEDVYVTGTISTYEAIAKVWGNNQSGYNELLNRPGVEFTNPAHLGAWDGQVLNRYNNSGSLNSNLSFQKQFTKEFHDAGIKLLLGTDSPVIVGLPAGFSIHEDIRIFSEMGISNQDILRIASVNFGEFVKKYSRYDEDFGIIKEGFRADLVLLKENPLDNLETFRDVKGVMVKGKWYSEENLESELENIRTQ